MPNYGKYYIAVRLLLLKQRLEANTGRNRIALQSRIYSSKPSTKVFPLGKHIFFFFIKNTLQNAKTGSTSQLFWGVGCASLLYFCEKWDLNFLRFKVRVLPSYFRLSATATATETVAPTMGLLPMPRKPIIST